MSVLPCARGNCPNVMCERYSDKYGYICRECFEELVQIGPSADVADFMETNPSGYDTAEASRAYFNEIFAENN